ncbi:TPA: hypothetical protein KIA93_000334 [Salmonella enterica]|uniref:ParE family toxin-like protein n=1 Tax=Salmonella enterica TaxID=28901 RepID=UPI0009AFB146|nr:hypothetical protein [Salmonella enterica]HBD1844128.1 hypothetical protein [Salmonella enterica]
MPKLREIAPGLRAPATIPAIYCQKACQQVEYFREGRRNYARIDDKGTGYLKINVGPFWRLLSRDKGLCWELMSHERYNNAIRR